MLRTLRNRITPSTVIATFALVFAMTGGAYAAGHYLITSTKQISPKVLKTLKGASGKTGATGATGATGPAGAAGPQGPAGNNGSNGGPGEPGKAGESVTTKAASGTECTSGVGGTSFSVGGKTEHVCNGKNGTTGFTDTLPSGKTETGTYVAQGSVASGESLVAAISFPIPLAKAVTPHFVGGVDPGCPGKAEKPEAAPGNLCVYELAAEHLEFSTFLNIETQFANNALTSKFGDLVGFNATAAGPQSILGSWAVTAE